MSKKKDIIVSLYKAAKKHDSDILKHFKDENLSDKDYFWYALNEDIMSNLQSLILNHTIHNFESPTVDNNCRSIIEALALLSMYCSGKIKPLQLKIFRYSYSLVEIDNYESITKVIKQDIPSEILSDKETVLNLFAEQFKISREELDKLLNCKDRKKRIYLQDPLAFLAKSPSQLKNIKYFDIIHKYLNFNNIVEIYSFFSIFEHPRYEEDMEAERMFLEARTHFVKAVFELVIAHFNANKLFLEDEDSISDDSTDIFGGEFKEENITNLQLIDYIFESLNKELSVYGDNYDGMSMFFINKLHCIAKSIYITKHRGLNEQTLSAFRAFVEYASTINYINTFDVKTFYSIRKAFTYSSRKQLVNIVDKVLGEETIIDEYLLKKAYNEYYKDAYQLSDYQKFKNEISNNSLYCITNSYKNYRQIVFQNAELITNNNKELKIDLITTYKIALDLAHASGYSFNSSVGISVVHAERANIIFWRYVYLYASLNERAKIEHGYKVNIRNILDIISQLISDLNIEFNEKYA